MSIQVAVRVAAPHEADALTDIAMRAKASWGYSDEFMEACRTELTMTPAKMASWTIWIAEVDQVLCGMIALDLGRGDGRAELEDFFVDPGFQRRGVGAALMSKLLEACRSCGVDVVGLDADPNAQAVYGRFGFVTVGCAPSRSIPGRMLPRMELRIA